MEKIVMAPNAVSRPAPIVYDAQTVGRILGLPVLTNTPAPAARDGEIVLYYGGWTLQELRESRAGMEHMWWHQEWYDSAFWTVDAGYYCVDLRVPASNAKSWYEQYAFLMETRQQQWLPAPVCVAASAILVHLAKAEIDLLGGDWCRCAEQPQRDLGVVLTVGYHRLRIDDGWHGRRNSRVWLAASQRC